MNIKVKKLSSGCFHITGEGPCNWSTVKKWPCHKDTVRECADLAVCDEFINDATRLAIETELSSFARECLSNAGVPCGDKNKEGGG